LGSNFEGKQLKRNKTFIVGAGASAELGLPTGRELVEEIERVAHFTFDDFGQFSSGDRILMQAFGQLPNPPDKRWNPNGLANVATKVRANMGLAPSIDFFLDSKQNVEGWSQVGKLLIARCILSAEHKSRLYFDRNKANAAPGFAELPTNWLSELFRLLVAKRGLKGFCDGLVSCRFVTFNYDRTTEQFFHQAIKSWFVLDDVEVDKICAENLQVVHVYGGLGDVNCALSGNFGDSENPSALVSAASRIQTFTETVRGAHRIDKARD
jgi:hypothetical protein